MLKKFTIIHFTLLFLSLLYSFKFYKNISLELAVMAVLFDIIVPTLFITAVGAKKEKKIIFTVLVTILIMFNLLAISSSFINNYNKQSTTKVLNTDYATHQEKLKQLKNNLDNIQNELNKYPTLVEFTASSPKWEEKTVLNKNWQDGKQDITNRLNAATTEYDKELSIKVDQYKIIKNDIGYSEIFETISKKINIESKNLVLTLYLLFAVMLQILIFYTKTLSVKEFSSYKKSNEELELDLFNDFKNKIFAEKMKMLEDNLYNFSSAAEKEKVKIVVKDVDQKQITEKQDEEFTVDEILNGLEIHDEQEEKPKKIGEKIPISLKNYELFKKYMLKNLDSENISIGYKKICDQINENYANQINHSEGLRIFNLFKIKELIETKDRKTYVDKERLEKINILEVIKDD